MINLSSIDQMVFFSGPHDRILAANINFGRPVQMAYTTRISTTRFWSTSEKNDLGWLVQSEDTVCEKCGFKIQILSSPVHRAMPISK